MKIGMLTIDPPLVLAPMAGLTHLPFRSAVAAAGGAGLYHSEMLSARALTSPTAKDRYLLAADGAARPFFFQIFAAEPGDVVPALERLLPLSPDGIDLNLACPAPQVRKRGGGGSLGGDLQRAVTVVSAVRACFSLPLTCKVRLPDPSSGTTLAQVAAALGDAGADGITVHARHPKDGLDRPARWGRIAEARVRFHGTLVVNGGIFAPADAVRALSESGADGVMLARGALRDPSLGGRTAAVLGGRPDPGPTPPREFLARLAAALRDFFPETQALRALRLHLHYAAPGIPFGHHLWRLTRQARAFDEAVTAVEGFFSSRWAS